MNRVKLIQVRASVQEPLRIVMDKVRATVSKVCGGIDDMQLLGNKALVIRAEIYPEKLPALYTALTSIGITINKQNLLDQDALKEKLEHPITLQITSFSDETDSRVNIPKVPG
ncbi:MAG: hypothetical protein V7745_06430 [Pseudomonadales bacterium]